MKMLRLVIFAVVAVVITSGYSFDSYFDEEWIKFKKVYNKPYIGEEELSRRKIWQDNVMYIEKHNLAADRGDHTYTLGMNKYGDMTTEEFNRIMNRYIMPANRTKDGSLFLTPNNINLPTTVDWRDKGYVTPVKDQGQCGSCWSFSSTGALEGQHFRKTGKLVSLSEQNLMDCSHKEGNNGCAGGWINKAFAYIKKNKGIDTETSYPYLAKTNYSCHYTKASVGATVSGIVNIKTGSETDLQQAVATVGPVSVAIDASQKTFHLYKSGVYSSPGCKRETLDHAVLVVGYGTEDGQDYWLVKNSWATTWGDNGYIKMARNKNNMCGIATDASYPKV